MKRITLALLMATALLGGCQRPQAVRRVASLAQPLAVDLQRSAARLETRMANQASAFDRYAATLAAQEARARAHQAAIERDFRLEGNEAALRKLAVMREGEAAVIADPLHSVAASAPALATRRQPLNANDLNAVIAGLARMSVARQIPPEELVAFFAETNRELGRSDQEGAAAAPADPTAPVQPAGGN